MIKAIALDDEPPALDVIGSFCRQVSALQFEKGFTGTANAIRYIESDKPDLLFLDINMPAVNGIDLYRSLQHKPMLILTTSYSEFALESYEVGAIDYLLKPFAFARFEQAVLKAQHLYNLVHQPAPAGQSDYLAVKVDYGIVKVPLAEILFVEGLDNYLKIHLKHQPPLVLRMTMKALAEKLDDRNFTRVHRSYIVAIRHVSTIKSRIISILDNEIPIGSSYEEEFLKRFNT